MQVELDTATMPLELPESASAIMLSTREAAEYAGVSIDVLTAWRVRGLVPATKVAGRWGFAPADLDATLERLYAGDIRPRWQRDPLRCGARLRTLREASGMSQRDLALAVGLSGEQVFNLEHGQSSPRGATIRLLTAALGVAPDAFLTDGAIDNTAYLTTREAAEILGVPVIRLRKWVAAGVLPARKVGDRWQIPHQAVTALDRGHWMFGPTRRLVPGAMVIMDTPTTPTCPQSRRRAL